MVNFEAGTLVKGAYVVVDGVELKVNMPEYSGNTPLSAEKLNQMQKELLETVFPIGSTYVTQTNTNPNTILKFGTWERLKGKVCLGLDENDSDLNTIGNKKKKKTHTLTVNEMPSHYHNPGGDYMVSKGDSSVWGTQMANTSDWCAVNVAASASATGGSQAHNNMQPYEVVGYMWIRRA